MLCSGAETVANADNVRSIAGAAIYAAGMAGVGAYCCPSRENCRVFF